MEELYSKADPGLLNRYRAIFRKEVPFSKRSYLAAYLLTLEEQGGHRERPGWRAREIPASGRKSGGTREYAARTDEEKRALPEEESALLFVGAGRKRGVFQGEILGFITAKAQVKGEDIGIIRVLDSFSFVQVRKNIADTIIAAVSGQRFRGRPLTVNYARTRDEAPQNGENPPEQHDD